jgi:hypothetical protein
VTGGRIKKLKGLGYCKQSPRSTEGVTRCLAHCSASNVSLCERPASCMGTYLHLIAGPLVSVASPLTVKVSSSCQHTVCVPCTFLVIFTKKVHDFKAVHSVHSCEEL